MSEREKETKVAERVKKKVKREMESQTDRHPIRSQAMSMCTCCVGVPLHVCLLLPWHVLVAAVLARDCHHRLPCRPLVAPFPVSYSE